MRKLIKKTVALTAAFAMTLSMSAVASAETGTSGDLNSDSQLEGYVDKTVYDITVPTIAEDGLDFTVDPQGLLKIADNGAGDYNIASGAVYFANSAGGFSNTSDEIKIFNNSSFAIDVSLDVTVKAKDAGITLVEQAALSGATDPSLYLGLIVDGGAAEAITADTYEGTPVTLDAVEEVTSDSNKGYMIKASDSPFPGLEDATPSPNEKYYTYALTSSYVLGTDGDSVAYKLEGACDDASTADWSNVATNVLSAQIVWSVEAEELTPPEPDPVDDYVMSLSDEDITYTFVAALADDIEKVFIILPDGTSTERTGQLTAGNISYDSDSKKLTINPVAQSKCTITNAGTYKIKLVLADTSEVTLTYVKN